MLKMEMKSTQEKVPLKQSSDKIPLYNSVVDFLTSLGLPRHTEPDFTIDTLENYFKGKLIRSKAFKSNFFVFVYITGGNGFIMVDNEKYKVGPNTFYYINPGHLRAINIAKSLKGYMLSTNEQFLKRYYKGNLYRDFPFLEYSMIPPIVIEGTLANCFKEYLTAMLHTYMCEKGPYKYQIINNLTIAFQYKIKELFLTSSAVPYKKYNGPPLLKHFMKVHDEEFTKLVYGHRENRITLKELANLMHVHPNYLGAVIKKATGKSVSQWISGKEIFEAQALLLNTELSVSQIADKLGFDEPSNFIKFFKKIVKLTPKEYRNQAMLNNS